MKRRCTSRQRNTHRTELRQVRYPWHPWFGRSVTVYEALTKGGHVICRCGFDDRRNDRSLEVPAWMFEPAACDHLRLTATPFVDSQALIELKAALQTALRADVLQAPVLRQYSDRRANHVTKQPRRGRTNCSPPMTLTTRWCTEETSIAYGELARDNNSRGAVGRRGTAGTHESNPWPDAVAVATMDAAAGPGPCFCERRTVLKVILPRDPFPET